MYNSVPMDAGYFAASVIMGAITAFLYDILRISRRVVKVSDGVVNTQDILFFVVMALLWFLVAYVRNAGELRFHGIAGAAIGILIYAFIVRNRFVKIGTIVTLWMIKMGFAVLKIVFFPIKLIGRALKKPVRIVAWYTGLGMRQTKQIVRRGKFKMRVGLKSAAAMLKNRR